MTTSALQPHSPSKFNRMAHPNFQREPHNNITGTNGQFYDEYDDISFEKLNDAHNNTPPKQPNWSTTPDVQKLPSSCLDEFDDEGVFTTVGLSMIRNAAYNSLVALKSIEYDTKNEQKVQVTEENCIRALECTAQQYDWGKIGSNSMVARMKASQTSDFNINETKPYAELWVGTHPNGMSKVIVESADGVPVSYPLIDYVQQNPDMHLGVEGKSEPSQDYDLTFLFKVLSIEKVLSIQAHPDKRLAAQLFTDRPDLYKDPNHKPEMAVALTDDFEAMSGFRPISDIASNLIDYPEFSIVIGAEHKRNIMDSVTDRRANTKALLRGLFKSYMEADNDVVQLQLDALILRLSKKDKPTDLDKLILKLSNQFPGDSGIFAPIIFNYLKLKIGDAFYIGANEPHAYIHGEILECMACSDNVVRAGLTPKHKDVETLVKMLTYKSTLPEVTRGKKIDNCTLLYVPPVEDFAIEIIDVPPGSSYEMGEVCSPSVLLTLSGSGYLHQGDVMSLSVDFGKSAFMSANTSAVVTADENGLKIVRALSNVHL